MTRNIHEGARSVISADRLRKEAEALDREQSAFPARMAATANERAEYEAIIAAYPKSYLTDHQRAFIANLARIMALIDREFALFADEESIEYESRPSRDGGYEVRKINPRWTLISQLLVTAQRMRRSLGLSLELLGGGSRKEGAGASSREAGMAYDMLDQFLNAQAPADRKSMQ